MDLPIKAFVKPTIKLKMAQGNVYAMVGKASRALRKAGYIIKAQELLDDALPYCHDYVRAQSIVEEYVDLVRVTA